MDNLISRKAAVESLCNVFSHAGCDNCKYNDGSICCEECTISKYTNWGASEIVIAKALDDVPDTNVGDMISRQAAIDECNKRGAEHIGHAIAHLPSAQPEVIRCRDCKHYYYADNRIPQEQKYVCDLDSDRWNPDDYCSYAERRTNE